MLAAQKFIPFVFVLAGLCLVSVRAEGETILVDQLTGDYLKVEQSLWRVIEKREASTLQQIYNIHTRFMSKNYGQTDALQGDDYLPPHPGIVKSLEVINETTAKLAEEFFENRNYVALSAVAEKGIQLVRETDNIYLQTVNSTAFWESIKNLTKSCGDITEPRDSEHQVLLEYYKDIQAVALKTYISSQLSYMILHLHESGNFRELSIAYRQNFIDQNEDVKNAFTEHLKGAGKEVYQCVSIKDQNLDTNLQITRFLQGYIDNEVTLNPEGTCTLTCADYKKTYVANCPAGSVCGTNEARKCNGVLRDCHGMQESLDICPSKWDDRRYSYVRLENKKFIGDDSGYCSKEINIKSWIRWFVKCSNCFCLCDDHSGSDRYFSLREVVSNIYENKIVTGIRLVKHNQLIQFEIVERELYSVIHKKSQNESIVLSPLFQINDTEVQEGTDYHTLTYQNRAINLDTVTVPAGQVVTGVRFHIVNGRVSIQVRGTEFDLNAGTLENLSNSTWISSSSGGVNQIRLSGRKRSTKASRAAEPNEVPNAYIEFGPTDINDDLSQFTIPFIDSFRVEPKVATLLSGIGLYHKGQPGYGGFIAPKLVVYPLEPNVIEREE